MDLIWVWHGDVFELYNCWITRRAVPVRSVGSKLNLSLRCVVALSWLLQPFCIIDNRPSHVSCATNVVLTRDMQRDSRDQAQTGHFGHLSRARHDY
jgi:hypothetical protein